MPSFPFYQQLDSMDCGPSCLRMVAKHYGRSYSLQYLRDQSHITREGVSMLGISQAAETIGLRSLGVKIDFQKLTAEAPLPVIAHWKQNHFVVVHTIKKDKVYVADPGHGLITYKREEFLKHWLSDQQNGQAEGVILLLEATPTFYEREAVGANKSSLRYLLKYLTPYRKFLTQLFVGLLLGSLLQLIFPFLTQAIVDVGIGTRNVNFIWLILIAQLVLFVSRTSVEIIRSWILLHISTRINISLISDFLMKLMKLPISFFDRKMTGDLMQRINDHRRIESFLTGNMLNTLFSLLNFVIFSIVLLMYSTPIFLIFLLGSSLYIGWVFIFMEKRRQLDHKSFAQLSANQSKIIQLIHGMPEIKLNNIEQQKRWEWERIQAALFRVQIKQLSLNQYQQVGSGFFNEVKNIVIIFLAAKSVIDGQITLGMMMAISYILGQLNAPLMQLLTFIRAAQDARISLERLGEVQQLADEESDDLLLNEEIEILPHQSQATQQANLHLENVSFRYAGPESPEVLKDIQLEIPQGKITALVGTSGSGKTTLLKLLLKFYPPLRGIIRVGQTDLAHIRHSHWRQQCGVVMQDGFIFSDSIAYNIALDDPIDKRKLLHAAKVANIQDFIASLPLRYNTQIGQEGVGLSAGQKQRLLIARAVYKNPAIILFDEATNALDANNERIIMQNLDEFFKGRTVIVVAHRLSTVKHADQIVVLAQGKIVERGTHQELTQMRGAYFHLVKNQLELGK